MGEYALLTEVWGPEYGGKKPKKEKKKKKRNDEEIPILEPSEMDKELLEEPSEKVRKMSISPYSKDDSVFQPMNPNIVRTQPKQVNPIESRYFDDPEYQEFLEFKKMKSNRFLLPQSNEQMNELLLYVFTGFFLLMLYDSIYKFGKDSY